MLISRTSVIYLRIVTYSFCHGAHRGEARTNTLTSQLSDRILIVPTAVLIVLTAVLNLTLGSIVN
jgi:hypothetical protein